MFVTLLTFMELMLVLVESFGGRWLINFVVGHALVSDKLVIDSIPVSWGVKR